MEFEQSPLAARWVDIAQTAPPPAVEQKSEPWITLRSAVLVFIAIAFVLTLASIEVLFRGTIYERPRSKEDAGRRCRAGEPVSLSSRLILEGRHASLCPPYDSCGCRPGEGRDP